MTRSTSFDLKSSEDTRERRRLSCARHCRVTAERCDSLQRLSYKGTETLVPHAATTVLNENMREDIICRHCCESTMRHAGRHRLEWAGTRSVPADILTVVLHFT